MINYQLTVSGLVQGVGFRWSCLRLAQQLGVVGLVKNLSTGQVYIEVQGNPNAVTKFINQVAKGPTPYAQVCDIQQEEASLKDYRSFTIRR